MIDADYPTDMEDDGEGVEHEAMEKSAPWLAMIQEAEKVFKDYQTRMDNIDRVYADLNTLARDNRDREFQLFWANTEVLKPSIYARAPIPVVVPRFKDRRPLYRTASEMLERTTVVSFELTNINDVMLGVRDDLILGNRGVPWVIYKSGEGETYGECTKVLHVDRKDFLHEPARKWSEVGWVAYRAWLTEEEVKARFKDVDPYELAKIVFKAPELSDKWRGGTDKEPKAGIWEIWHKGKKKVCWVVEGLDEVLELSDPHLKLDGFFPCPKPAFGTVQPSSLLPVPDVLQYKDQLDEINELTGRIGALSSALQVRGFYSAGSGELGDAIEAALSLTTNNKVLIPISNWAAFGGGAAKDSIVWLPTDMVATTIVQCVELRRQLIEDVYQIVGLSDIMRGTTDPNETLGAQSIKAQYGSVRIRDKINEMARVAKDLVNICAEIIAEQFDKKSLLAMSQMELPTDAEIKQQIKALEQQGQAIQEQARVQSEGVQDPEQLEQMADEVAKQLQALEEQGSKLKDTVTIDQVIKFLRDEKVRPFVLDIETDSTIQPDEQAEKQARTEFMQAFIQTSASLGQMVAATPQFAPLAGEMLKFALAPFRAGRELEGAIDEFVDNMSQQASQPSPQQQALQQQAQMDQQRLQIETEKAKAVVMTAEANAAKAQTENQIKMAEIQASMREQQETTGIAAATARADIEKTMAQVEEIRAKIEKMGIDALNDTRQQDREDIKAVSDIQMRQTDQVMAAENNAQTNARADRQQALAERGDD